MFEPAALCAECVFSEQRLATDEKEGKRRAADDTARREDLIDAVVFFFASVYVKKKTERAEAVAEPGRC